MCIRILLGFHVHRWIKISQADRDIREVSGGSIFVLITCGVVMHAVFLIFTWAAAAALKLPLYDMKAVVITSSQKTLGVGVAIIAFLPTSFGVQGLIILPSIFCHFAQILMDGVMVPWWQRRADVLPMSLWMFGSQSLPAAADVNDSPSKALQCTGNSDREASSVSSIDGSAVVADAGDTKLAVSGDQVAIDDSTLTVELTPSVSPATAQLVPSDRAVVVIAHH